MDRRASGRQPEAVHIGPGRLAGGDRPEHAIDRFGIPRAGTPARDDQRRGLRLTHEDRQVVAPDAIARGPVGATGLPLPHVRRAAGEALRSGYRFTAVSPA